MARGQAGIDHGAGRVVFECDIPLWLAIPEGVDATAPVNTMDPGAYDNTNPPGTILLPLPLWAVVNQLDDTDPDFGMSGITNGSGDSSREVEWTTVSLDSVTLSADRRTIGMNFAVGPAFDDIRIATKTDVPPPVPEPGTPAMLAIGLAALVWRFSGRALRALPARRCARPPA